MNDDKGSENIYYNSDDKEIEQYQNKVRAIVVKVNYLEKILNFAFGIALIIYVYSKIFKNESGASKDFKTQIDFNKNIYIESLDGKKFKSDEEKFFF